MVKWFSCFICWLAHMLNLLSSWCPLFFSWCLPFFRQNVSWSSGHDLLLELPSLITLPCFVSHNPALCWSFHWVSLVQHSVMSGFSYILSFFLLSSFFPQLQQLVKYNLSIWEPYTNIRVCQVYWSQVSQPTEGCNFFLHFLIIKKIDKLRVWTQTWEPWYSELLHQKNQESVHTYQC